MMVMMMIMITTSTFLLEQLKCEQRGCCWSPLDERNAPWCFFSTNHGYTVESVEQPNPYGKSLFPLSLPCSPTHALSDWWKYLAFYLAYFLILTAPRSFNLPVCPPHIVFPFSLTLPKAWFSVKCDMDGISENMIDFAACRFFHFLLDFTAFCELSYCVKPRRENGHLKSELQHFSNSIRTFFEKTKKKHYLWACFVWQRWLNWKKWQMLRLRGTLSKTIISLGLPETGLMLFNRDFNQCKKKMKARLLI